MEFGVFDHVDRSDLALSDYYETRLNIVQAYDRGGFYGYHVAEHHSTPLGMAASPGVYLAAVAQRTSRLRFGPLVYTLPLYHPLRLTEEICMLDQLSGGRLDIGIGRGISPLEARCYAIPPDERPRRYEETWQVVQQGLTQTAVDFEGEFFRFKNVPMELAPLQQPHPPVWLGLASPDSAARAATNGHNFVSLSTAGETRVLTDRYRQAWRQGHDEKPLPKLGLGRFIVVGETDEAALALARRAYTRWHASFHDLWYKFGATPTRGFRAPHFDETLNGGRGIAGSPESVAKAIDAQMTESGSNYCVGQFVFGDMSEQEAHNSIDLFVRHVMPALR